MIELLLEVLVKGLELKNTIESNKYKDEVLKLQKEFLNEYKKPRKLRSNANLDHIEQQLYIISKLFVTTP